MLVVCVLWPMVMSAGDRNPAMREYPDAIPDMTGWTVDISGWGEQPEEIPLTNATISYALWSDPARPLLYAVYHYQLRQRDTSGTFEYMDGPYPGNEVIYWLYPIKPHGYAARVFIRYDGVWREFPEGSPEYRREEIVQRRLTMIPMRVDHLTPPLDTGSIPF
jgi:hypothetical protein